MNIFQLKSDCYKHIKKKIWRTPDHEVPCPSTFIYKTNPAHKTQGKLFKSGRKNASDR